MQKHPNRTGVNNNCVCVLGPRVQSINIPHLHQIHNLDLDLSSLPNPLVKPSRAAPEQRPQSPQSTITFPPTVSAQPPKHARNQNLPLHQHHRAHQRTVSMSPSLYQFGALSAATCISMNSYGAHTNLHKGHANIMSFNRAAQYQMVHSLALM